MKVIECPQGGVEWWLHRRGIPTASNFGRILTPKTLKLSASAEPYACELLADLYRSGAPIDAEAFTSRAMLDGLNTEPEARRWYEFEAGQDVRRVGFCTTDDGRFGCSPDGLVGEDGGLELKCPELKTHIAYLLAGELPADYRPQVHGSLIVTGRSWWDFCSYAPGLPPFLLRVTPDEYTDALREALEQFWARFQEMKATLARLDGAAERLAADPFLDAGQVDEPHPDDDEYQKQPAPPEDPPPPPADYVGDPNWI